MPCKLWLDPCILHQWTSFSSSQTSNLLSFVTKGPHCTLCHEAWTSTPPGAHHALGGKAQYLKSSHPFAFVTQQLISSSGNNIRAAHRSPMECRVAGQHYETVHFHPRHWHPPGMILSKTAWVQLNCLCTNVVRFYSWLHKWVWLPLQPVSVVKKNKPSTMLSSNVQFINVPMDCMAWPLWKTRQMNGSAQHMPWDLVQPSGGRYLLKRWRRKSSFVNGLSFSMASTLSNCFCCCNRL